MIGDWIYLFCAYCMVVLLVVAELALLWLRYRNIRHYLG